MSDWDYSEQVEVDQLPSWQSVPPMPAYKPEVRPDDVKPLTGWETVEPMAPYKP